jgi:hypothetical protein
MYIVYGQHNDLYFFDERTDLHRCAACGHMLSKWEADLTVVPIKKYRRYDVGTSYDGVRVVSKRFKSLYEDSGMTGLLFTPLEHDLYAIRAQDVVLYDQHCQGTRFEDKCEVCGEYESVVRGTPVCLMPGASVPALGFVRTDLEFATKDEKHPLTICGDEAAKILKAAKLKGLSLEKVKT